MSKKPQVRVVTATEAKNRFGELIKSAYLRQEHLIVKRDGIPVVAIVPIADYAELINSDGLPEELADEVAWSGRLVRARNGLAHFLDQAHADLPKVGEDEAALDIEEAIRGVRAHEQSRTRYQRSSKRAHRQNR
jgi:prevent-host-death family protein